MLKSCLKRPDLSERSPQALFAQAQNTSDNNGSFKKSQSRSPRKGSQLYFGDKYNYLKIGEELMGARVPTPIRGDKDEEGE